MDCGTAAFLDHWHGNKVAIITVDIWAKTLVKTCCRAIVRSSKYKANP